MLTECMVIWLTTSVIVASETTTTERSRFGDDDVHFHGGRPAKRGEFPFLVLLLVDMDYQNWEQRQCSGSILSPTAVLTAAHCDVGDITVIAGLEDRMEAEVENKYVQMRYVESVAKPVYPIIYDIMICYINREWDWSEFVAPVALHLNVSRLQPSFVISCKVLGFGVTKKDRVPLVAHVMDQLVGTSSQCLNIHPFIWFWSFWMCSINIKNKTMCMADSGGPVVCSTAGGYHQWAVNMGMGPEQEMDCVPMKTANIYIATAPLRNWIVDNVKDLAYIPSSADSIQRSTVKISLYEDRPQSGVGGRIYAHGGRPVQPGEFPFLVLLDIVGIHLGGICSGSIPSPTTVLTAAHCDVGDITAYAGIVSNEEKELKNGQMQVRSVVSTAKYPFPVLCDIMVCHLNQSWEWTEAVAPVTLQLTESSPQPSFVIGCQVMGFGQSETGCSGGVAHVMDQLIGNSGQCMDVMAIFIFLTPVMCSINVEKKTMCGGDSGGPAVCDGKQWGINMGGSPKEKGDLCLPPMETNIYTRIAYFRDWILANIKDLPSSADSILRCAVKISMCELLLYTPLWLLLSSTVDILYLH